MKPEKEKAAADAVETQKLFENGAGQVAHYKERMEGFYTRNDAVSTCGILNQNIKRRWDQVLERRHQK